VISAETRVAEPPLPIKFARPVRELALGIFLMTCPASPAAAPASIISSYGKARASASSRVTIDWAVGTSSSGSGSDCGSVDGSGEVVFSVSAGDVDSGVVFGVDLAKHALLLADPSFGLHETPAFTEQQAGTIHV